MARELLKIYLPSTLTDRVLGLQRFVHNKLQYSLGLQNASACDMSCDKLVPVSLPYYGFVASRDRGHRFCWCYSSHC